MARFTIKIKLTAQTLYAFLHVSQTKSSMGSIEIESNTIIANFQNSAALYNPTFNRHPIGLGMFLDIGN